MKAKGLIRIAHWLWAQLMVDEPTLEGRAVATRIEGDTYVLPEWKIVVQLRHPKADFDAVYSIQWVSPEPPSIEDILSHYYECPQDFTFIDFLPNRSFDG